MLAAYKQPKFTGGSGTAACCWWL